MNHRLNAFQYIFSCSAPVSRPKQIKSGRTGGRESNTAVFCSSRRYCSSPVSKKKTGEAEIWDEEKQVIRIEANSLLPRGSRPEGRLTARVRNGLLYSHVVVLAEGLGFRQVTLLPPTGSASVANRLLADSRTLNSGTVWSRGDDKPEALCVVVFFFIDLHQICTTPPPTATNTWFFFFQIYKKPTGCVQGFSRLLATVKYSDKSVYRLWREGGDGALVARPRVSVIPRRAPSRVEIFLLFWQRRDLQGCLESKVCRCLATGGGWSTWRWINEEE